MQITHLPTGIVVKSQATRSRSQNHKIANQILAEKVELLQKGDESRAAKKIEVKSKRKASASKKSKRKYKALEDSKSDRAAVDMGKEINPELHDKGDGPAQDDQRELGPDQDENDGVCHSPNHSVRPFRYPAHTTDTVQCSAAVVSKVY